MAKPRKLPTISKTLLVMERDLEELRSRIGLAELPQWDAMNRKEQNEGLLEEWPEIIRLWRGLRYVQAKLGRIGRQKGDRTKLTPSMLQRIKSNGRRKITALARELGISRQTIYTVLRES